MTLPAPPKVSIPPKISIAPIMQNSPLLNLSAEIRNEIYTILVVSQSLLQPLINNLLTSTQIHEKTYQSFLALPHEKTLALARTCSQIHDEVIPLYFGKNRFYFHTTYELYTFLHMIGEYRRSFIRDIEFNYHGCCQKEAFELLGHCTALRKVTLGLSRKTMKGSRNPQRDLWTARGTRYLMMVKGLKNVEISYTQSKCWFSQDHTYRLPLEQSHAEEFVRGLQEGMREEMGICDEVLLAEKTRLEKLEAKEKEMENLKVENNRQWKEFEEKQARRLKEESSGLRRSGRVIGKPDEVLVPPRSSDLKLPRSRMFRYT